MHFQDRKETICIRLKSNSYLKKCLTNLSIIGKFGIQKLIWVITRRWHMDWCRSYIFSLEWFIKRVQILRAIFFSAIYFYLHQSCFIILLCHLTMSRLILKFYHWTYDYFHVWTVSFWYLLDHLGLQLVVIALSIHISASLNYGEMFFYSKPNLLLIILTIQQSLNLNFIVFVLNIYFCFIVSIVTTTKITV